MPESWFELSSADQSEALEVAAGRSGRPAHLLEKDIWVVWALSAIYDSPLGDSLTFKGGTSLSKVYKVIDRFTGQDSVNQLGAMLQVQMKVSGSPDQAANNLKNWFSKIGSPETQRRYADAGIDYSAMMQEAIGKGWSTMESSFVLARAYIEQADPQRAQQVSAAAQRIGEERDPAKQQAMLQAFEATMKTGDLFADMQVKAALTAYMQNADLYQRLKQNAARATGEIEQDLIARRETSKQIWSEVTQAWDEALRRIGDALRPVTDTVGQALGSVGRALATLVAQAPMVVAGLATVAGGLVALKGAVSPGTSGAVRLIWCGVRSWRVDPAEL